MFSYASSLAHDFVPYSGISTTRQSKKHKGKQASNTKHRFCNWFTLFHDIIPAKPIIFNEFVTIAKLWKTRNRENMAFLFVSLFHSLIRPHRPAPCTLEASVEVKFFMYIMICLLSMYFSFYQYILFSNSSIQNKLFCKMFCLFLSDILNLSGFLKVQTEIVHKNM